MDFAKTLAFYKEHINALLDEHLSEKNYPRGRLLDAMRHSMHAGGKRIRPVLCYATGHALGVQGEDLDAPALAVELIHTYSLIHDDLPAMDDDDLRRGQPTCHIAFDEATAILAGDAMLTMAFEVLAKASNLSSARQLKMVNVLAKASGANGMVLGQAIDVEAEGKGTAFSLDELKAMHANKTGALIKASVQLGALCNELCTPEQYKALSEYAEHIGLAFQVQDDILDVTASTQDLGKQQGADEALNKPTYTSLMGLERAQAVAQELHQKALACLDGFDERADTLRGIADYIIQRTH